MSLVSVIEKGEQLFRFGGNENDSVSDENRREKVYDACQKKAIIKPMFTSLKKKHLKHIYDLYDELVYNGELGRKLREKNKEIRFQLSKGTEKSRIGGWCKPTNEGFIINFPKTLFESLVCPVKNSGIVCQNRLLSLMVTLEHEMTHLIIFLFGKYKKKRDDPSGIYTTHGKLFRYLTHYYFGHTEYHHHMGDGDPSKWTKLTDLSIGDYLLISPREISKKKQVPYKAKVIRINRKNLSVMRQDNGKILRVTPRVVTKISREKYGEDNSEKHKDLQKFAVGDYVRITWKKRIFHCRVTEIMRKNIVIQTTLNNQSITLKSKPHSLTKITPSEYINCPK